MKARSLTFFQYSLHCTFWYYTYSLKLIRTTYITKIQYTPAILTTDKKYTDFTVHEL